MYYSQNLGNALFCCTMNQINCCSNCSICSAFLNTESVAADLLSLKQPQCFKKCRVVSLWKVKSVLWLICKLLFKQTGQSSRKKASKIFFTVGTESTIIMLTTWNCCAARNGWQSHTHVLRAGCIATMCGGGSAQSPVMVRNKLYKPCLPYPMWKIYLQSTNKHNHNLLSPIARRSYIQGSSYVPHRPIATV